MHVGDVDVGKVDVDDDDVDRLEFVGPNPDKKTKAAVAAEA